jgi:hypothetical protein
MPAGGLFGLLAGFLIPGAASSPTFGGGRRDLRRIYGAHGLTVYIQYDRLILNMGDIHKTSEEI